MIEIALAFAAGVLTAAAPCILPLLPVLLGASIGQQDRWRPLFLVAGFIMAFSGFAILFGSFSTVLGLSHDTLRKVSVVLLGSFGVLLLWPRPYEWLMVRLSGLLSFAAAIAPRAGSGHIGSLVLGLTLGVLWTPCAGPVLGSILTLIATSENLTRAALTALSAFCRKASKPAASSLRFNFRHCPFALGLFGCRRKRQNGVFDGHI